MRDVAICAYLGAATRCGPMAGPIGQNNQAPENQAPDNQVLDNQVLDNQALAGP